MPNKSVIQFDTLPTRARPTDIAYLIRGLTDNQATLEEVMRTSLTMAQASALVVASLLVPGTIYVLTDAVANSTISLIAKSTSTFFKNGDWALQTQLKAFGSIELLTGGAGTVDTITVNGVNILPAPVAFNTDLATTCSDVATGINVSSPGYTAYAINKVLVIQADAIGTAANGYVVSGTATIITLGNANNMANGVASSTRNLSVEYDFTENQIYAAYDALDNISYRMSKPVVDGLGYNPILNFRWGDTSYDTETIIGIISAWTDAQITDSDFTNCFAIETPFADSQFFVSDFSNNFHANSGFGISQFRYFRADGFSTNASSLNDSTFVNCVFNSTNLSAVDMSGCQLAEVNYMAGLVLANIDMEGSIIQKDNFQLSLVLVNSITGAANRGLVDSPITMGIIPDNFFPDRAVFTSTGLTGVNAELKAGIETNADDCMLPQTTVVLLNANPVVITQDPQQSTAIRNIIVTPKVATITAGDFKLFVSGKVGL